MLASQICNETNPPKPFSQCENIDADSKDLIGGLTDLDPAKRLTAQRSLGAQVVCGWLNKFIARFMCVRHNLAREHEWPSFFSPFRQRQNRTSGIQPLLTAAWRNIASSVRCMHNYLSPPAAPRPNAILKYNGRLVTPIRDTQRKQSATSSFAMKYNTLSAEAMSVHGHIYGSFCDLAQSRYMLR